MDASFSPRISLPATSRYSGVTKQLNTLSSQATPCDSRRMIIISALDSGVSGVSFFGAFTMMEGLVRAGREDEAEEMAADGGAWLRMLREGATSTFEGWGKDTKANASLFHLTMSDAAVFLADVDLPALFQ